MLTVEENELLTRTGPGTPMGELMRRYWLPAVLSWELPEPDSPPVRFSAYTGQPCCDKSMGLPSGSWTRYSASRFGGLF
jgi:hypothetical protein